MLPYLFDDGCGWIRLQRSVAISVLATFCWCSSLLFIFLQCSFCVEVEHFAIVYFCNNMVIPHESEPHQHYSLFKNKHKTSFTSYSPCCTSPVYCFNTFPQYAATDLHVTTWTPLGNVPLALPASVTALPLIIPLWVRLSHWWWAPPGDRHYTLAHELSLTHSLVSIQVEYSWFSLFVVVMFIELSVILNEWCWTIGLRGNTALCLRSSLASTLVPLTNTQPCMVLR